MTNPVGTDLKLYNTLTRTKEEFKPIDTDNVRMYVCGPTVYDFAHIGNARPVIVFDVLFRLLRHLYGEDHVTYVRNITDVDDKINARALRDFGADIASGKMSLNEAIRAVTEKTANQFHADVKALGCLEPTHEPRATEHIAGMVAMIQTLLDKGHAYKADGQEGAEILFRVTSMGEGGLPPYGKLSNRKLEDQQAGARVDIADHKENPGDFVLWKQSSSDQPGWQGDFTIDGEAISIHGRPGWHIECSVMSEAHLGKTFDIHGGGLDLIFPHHENEIAQSCCAHGTDRMANIWMHNGYLQVEGKKMSKSEGNFVTIHDLLHTKKFGGRKWPGEVLRLAMLMTHYREPIDFSVRRLEEAGILLKRWADQFQTIRNRFMSEIEGEGLSSVYVSPSLLDDLNLSPAISDLSRLGKSGAGGNLGDGLRFLKQFELLGFTTIHWHSQEHANFPTEFDDKLVSELEQAITQRLAFIREKNWAEADRIRDELLEQGIQLKDGKDPETGERITTWEVKR